MVASHYSSSSYGAKMTTNPIYLINPANDPASLRNTLRALQSTQLAHVASPQGGQSEEKKILLRIAESSEPLIERADILLKSTPMRRVYDDEVELQVQTGSRTGKFIDFPSVNPFQEACVELLKAVTDVDISLPMGYTIVEVPLGATSSEQVETDCVLTNENLYNYLASANATPVRVTEQEVGHSARWTGVEQIADREWLQSTMVFRATFRYVETTEKEAIDYLTMKLANKERILKTTAIGDSMDVKIYVIPNRRCVIPIIKESQFFTTPVSKQRLLYIYDFIHSWLQEHLKMWVEMRLNTKPIEQQSRVVCFQYRIEKMVPGWTKIPTLSVNPRSITHDLSIGETELWHNFMDDSSLVARMKSVIDLLKEYGIDMVVENFVGTMEDYMSSSERTSFVLPVREPTTISTIAQAPREEYRGRGRARGGRGATTGDTSTYTGNTSENHNYRGRGNGGRGRPTFRTSRNMAGREGNSSNASQTNRGTRARIPLEVPRPASMVEGER